MSLDRPGIKVIVRDIACAAEYDSLEEVIDAAYRKFQYHSMDAITKANLRVFLAMAGVRDFIVEDCSDIRTYHIVISPEELERWRQKSGGRDDR